VIKKIKLAINRFRAFQKHNREPGLTALLVVEVVLIFMVVPLSASGVLPALAVPIAFLLFVVATLMVTSRSHGATVLVLIAAILSPIGTFVHAEHPSAVTAWLSDGGRMLALAALTWVIAGAVFRSGRVTSHRVQGAVVLYLNFALFFFLIYRLITVHAPDAFTGLPAGQLDVGGGTALLYFSFTTLTTTGFGDITPLHPFARSIANLEAVIGQLYPATLLARLVSLEIAHRRRTKSGSAD
jgi:hypothetical protein